MATPPLPVVQNPNDEAQHKTSKVMGDALNGTHSLEGGSRVPQTEGEAQQQATPQAHSHNGVVYREQNPLSSQEPPAKEHEREGKLNEAISPHSSSTLPPSQNLPPPNAPTPPSSSVQPRPPSLVQSSSTVGEAKTESKTTAVRSAPPALVGYEALEKERNVEATATSTVDEDEMETNVNEERCLNADRPLSRDDSPQSVARGDYVTHEDKERGGSGDESALLQQRDVREESPSLVIDTGSQQEPVREAAPVISNQMETENLEKDKQVGVDSVTSNSQVSSDEIEVLGSPHSTSSNEEEVDLGMDIIEEGEETPPPAPPPKGVLMKAPSVTTTMSQAHIQSLSSRIGVSPSHTASRLALENLKKGSDTVRKPNVIVASPSSSLVVDLSRGGNNPDKEGGGGEAGKDRQSVVTDNFRVRQVAKVKQFFTTLQTFGNKNGSEVAEQVQELITAVVNETATVEEFHQEVQSVLNFPLKDFIIPFLKENLKHLRSELKESSHSLSELLGDDGSIPDTIGLTPQLVDDELPVLPSSSQASGPPIRSLGSSVITQSHQSGTGSSGSTGPPPTTTAVTKATPSRSGHTNVVPSRTTTHQQSAPTSTPRSHQPHGTGTGTVITPHSHSHSHSHTTVVLDGDIGADYVPSIPSVVGVQRKRSRRASFENRSSGVEKEMPADRQIHSGHLPKRPRPDHTLLQVYGGESTVTTQAPLSHLHPNPHYPQPPPIHSLTSTGHGEGGAYLGGLPLEHGGISRKKTLTEDWGHVQMMLTSIQGMVERARQAMALLKDRVNATQTELEKRELERDALIKQRVGEAVEKVKRQSSEEKQRLILEANSKLREAVSTARNELEGRMAQTQALAVQEALKDANAQSTSKENCWNCGRRATETCSGCNKARYCGTFCQHKDWANHMHHCASGLVGQGNVEETYERRDTIRHHGQPITLATNEVALVSAAGRGAPLRQTVAIPLNMVSGNEMSMHGIPARIPHSHTDIAVTVVKTEKV